MTRIAPNRIRALTLLAAVFLSVSACSGDSTNAAGATRATIDLRAMLSAAITSTVSDQITRVHVTLTRTFPQPHETLIDAVSDFTDPGRGKGGDARFEFTLGDADAEYELSITAANESGETLYSSGPVRFTGRDIDARGNVSVTATLQYIGPGSDAARVTATPSPLALEFGEQATLSVQVFGAADAQVARAPTELSVTGGDVVTVDQSGHVTAANRAGTATIVVKVFAGSQPSTTVPVTVAAPVRFLDLVSGNGQTAAPGAALPNDIAVRVRRGTNPSSGAVVTFSGGSVNPTSVTTGTDGLAHTVWTLSQTLGAQTITVSTPNATPLQVTATAATQQTTLALVSGGAQTGTVDAALAAPVVVSVMNGATPVSARSITFATTDGTLAPITTVTDALGRAQTVWTLGPFLGIQTMTATVANATGSPLTITATGTANSRNVFVTSIVPSAVSPGQSATIQATVSTLANLPVGGATVTFASTGTGNTFTPVSATTNASGVATTSFTSTQAENKSITATSGSTTSPPQLLPVAVQNTTGTSIVKVSGDNAFVPYLTNYTIVIQVRNALGLPVPNAFVDFGSAIGNLPHSTDANGNASQIYSMPNDQVNYPPNLPGQTRVQLAQNPTIFVLFTWTPVFPVGGIHGDLRAPLWLPSIVAPPVRKSK